MKSLKRVVLALGAGLAFLMLMCALALAAGPKKPDILVIWGDDIGQSNISAYTKGVMGYRTPNIDRIANEGMIFNDLKRFGIMGIKYTRMFHFVPTLSGRMILYCISTPYRNGIFPINAMSLYPKPTGTVNLSLFLSAFQLMRIFGAMPTRAVTLAL